MKLIEKGDRILLISAHPDDVELGCGGAIYQNRKDITTKLLVLSNRFSSNGEIDNEKEQTKAGKILGINDIQFEDIQDKFFPSLENRDQIRNLVTKVCNEFKPSLIFLPGINETHQDHSAIAEEVVRVIRDISILGYEITKHNRHFEPNTFIKITKKALEQKTKATLCYKGQNKKYYFDKKVIESLATMRASTFGYIGYAEAFELYNLIQKN